MSSQVRARPSRAQPGFNQAHWDDEEPTVVKPSTRGEHNDTTTFANFERAVILQACAVNGKMNGWLGSCVLIKVLMTKYTGPHPAWHKTVDAVHSFCQMSAAVWCWRTSRHQHGTALQRTLVIAKLVCLGLLFTTWAIGAPLVALNTMFSVYLEAPAEVLSHYLFKMNPSWSTDLLSLIHTTVFMILAKTSLHYSLTHILIRGLIDWVIMMAGNRLVQWQVRLAYQRHCARMAAAQPTPVGPRQPKVVEYDSDFDRLPTPGRIPYSLEDHAAAGSAISRVAGPEAPHVALQDGLNAQQQADAAAVTGRMESLDGTSTQLQAQLPALTARTALSAGSNTQRQVEPPAPATHTALPAEVSRQQEAEPLAAAFRTAQRLQARNEALPPYQSVVAGDGQGSELALGPVTIKLYAIQLQDLTPAALESIRHSVVRTPGMRFHNMAVRSGCVVMTLDVAAGTAVTPAEVAAAAMQWVGQTTLDTKPEDGSVLTVQVADQVFCLTWQDGSYQPTNMHMNVSEHPAVKASQEVSVDAASTTVACVPQSDNKVVQLSVRLVGLAGGHRLQGWQEDSHVSRTVECSSTLAAHTGQTLMLLARHSSAGYVPVTVKPSADSATAIASTSVAVEVDLSNTLCVASSAAPSLLQLELWAKGAGSAHDAHLPGQQLPGLEVLACTHPVLLLPKSGYDVCAELQQHAHVTLLQQQRRGSTSQASRQLSYDLGVFFGLVSLVSEQQSEVCDTATQPAFCGPDTAMQLGANLLAYAVRCDMPGLADLLVSALQSLPPPHQGPAAPLWLQFAAHGSTHTFSSGANSGSLDSLFEQPHVPRSRILHAAAASGSAEMLSRVLKWGVLYGGPDWFWPWGLEDESGCTALHLAAVQTPAVCDAMLACIRDALDEQQAAPVWRVWRSQRGPDQCTPADLVTAVRHRAVDKHGDGVTSTECNSICRSTSNISEESGPRSDPLACCGTARSLPGTGE